jgi:transcriptional regulator with XRE-family HTH domain
MAKRTTEPGRAIRRFLKARRQTQTWLAGEVGLTVSGLNDIVQGRRSPSLSVAVRLEAVTGVPVQHFAKSA